MRPTDTAAETEVAALDQYWLWRREKPGYTMLGAYIGRVLLTDRRLLFLSSGSSGIVHQLLWRSLPRTEHLDLSTLGRRGSLSLRLERIAFSSLARRRDLAWYLVIRTEPAPAVYTFMSKFGFDREPLADFQSRLEHERTFCASTQSR